MKRVLIYICITVLLGLLVFLLLATIKFSAPTMTAKEASEVESITIKTIPPIIVNSKTSRHLSSQNFKIPPNSGTTYYSPISLTFNVSQNTIDLTQIYFPNQSNIFFYGGNSSGSTSALILPNKYGDGYIYYLSNDSQLPVIISVMEAESNTSPSPSLSPCPITPTPSSSGPGTLHYVDTCSQCDQNLDFCFQADNNVLPEDTKSNYIMGSNLSDWGCSNLNVNTRAVRFENTTPVYILELPSSEGFKNNCSFLQNPVQYTNQSNISTYSTLDNKTIAECSNTCSMDPHCTGYLLQNFQNSSGTGTCLLQNNEPPVSENGTSIYCNANSTASNFGKYKNPQMVNPGNNCPQSTSKIYIKTEDKTLIDTVYNISESECSQRCQFDNACEMYLMGQQGNSISCELFSDVSNVETFCSQGSCPVPRGKYGKVKTQSIVPTKMELPRNPCIPYILVTYGYLNVNDEIFSPSGKFRLTLQPDHNLVIYNVETSNAVWATGTNNNTAVTNPTVTLLPDGNFVMISNYDPSIDYTSFDWQSGTANSAADMVILTDDGVLMVINYYNKIKYFESGTGGGSSNSNGLGVVPESLIPNKVFIDSSNFTPYRTLTTDYSSCMDICVADGNCQMALAADDNSCMLYDDYVPSTTTSLSTNYCNSNSYPTYGMVKSTANPSSSTMTVPFNTSEAIYGQFINATSSEYDSYTNVSQNTCNSICNNNLECQMALLDNGNTCRLYKNVSDITSYDTQEPNAQYYGTIKATNAIPCAADNGSNTTCCNVQPSQSVGNDYQCPSNKPKCVGYAPNQTYGSCQLTESFTTEENSSTPTESSAPTYTFPPVETIEGSTILPGKSLTLSPYTVVTLLSIGGGYILLDSSGSTAPTNVTSIGEYTSPEFTLESVAYQSPVNIILNSANQSIRFNFTDVNLPTNSTIYMPESTESSTSAFTNVLNLPSMLNSSTLFIYNENSNILNVVYSGAFFYIGVEYKSFVMKKNSFAILNYTLGFVTVLYQFNVSFDYQTVTDSDTCSSMGGSNFNYCPELGIYYCCGVCNNQSTPCPSNSSLVNCGCIPFNDYKIIENPSDIEKYTTGSYKLPTVNTFTLRPPAHYDFTRVAFPTQSIFILDKDVKRYTQIGTIHYISDCFQCYKYGTLHYVDNGCTPCETTNVCEEANDNIYPQSAKPNFKIGKPLSVWGCSNITENTIPIKFENDESDVYILEPLNWCDISQNRSQYVDHYTVGSPLSEWGCENITNTTHIVAFPNVSVLTEPGGETVTNGVFALEPSPEFISSNNFVTFTLPCYGVVNSGTYYTIMNPNPFVYMMIQCPQHSNSNNFSGLTNNNSFCLYPNYGCAVLLLSRSWFLVSYADELGNPLANIPLTPPMPLQSINFSPSPTPVNYNIGIRQVTQILFYDTGTNEADKFGYIIWNQDPCNFYIENGENGEYNFILLYMDIQTNNSGLPAFSYQDHTEIPPIYNTVSKTLGQINTIIANTNFKNQLTPTSLIKLTPSNNCFDYNNISPVSLSYFSQEMSVIYFDVIKDFETYNTSSTKQPLQWQTIINWITKSFLYLNYNEIYWFYQNEINTDFINSALPNLSSNLKSTGMLQCLNTVDQEAKLLFNSFADSPNCGDLNSSRCYRELTSTSLQTFNTMILAYAHKGNYSLALAKTILYFMYITQNSNSTNAGSIETALQNLGAPVPTQQAINKYQDFN